MRQLLNEVRQMRQQLLTMDARLRRLEKNSGRSGALPAKRPTFQQQTRLPANNLNTFAENDLAQYDINNEPQIFVEIGEARTRVPTSHGVPIAPIARAPVARAPVDWQTTRSQNNNQIAAIPFQDKRPVQTGGISSGVERGTLDGNQVSEQSVAQKLFERSRSALLARRYGAAESGFKSFLNKYASHNLASGAQFMLGETYYVQRNWRLAAQSYLKGYRKYPKSTKAGDTLLKLGMSLGKLGQKSQSCGAFETVVSKYKASGSAVRQARKEIVRAKC